jgi:transcriptional regulator with XRE-family HTH domain
MFSDRIDILMKKIGATNTEIAALAGVDRTNLSNFRSGKRLPKKDGDIIDKLVSALYEFASSAGKLKLLCQTSGSEKDASRDRICSDMKSWLYLDTPDEAFIRRKKKTAISLSFCERFNAAINLAETNNQSLSRAVHVDSSLISHYRAGIRTPASNPKLAMSLSNVLFDGMIRNSKGAQLAETMRVDIDEVTYSSFHEWLYSSDQNEDGGTTAMKFLETFDSYQSVTGIILPEVNIDVSGSFLSDTRTVYSGTDGLREAVLRFLTTASGSGAKEMYLYSDQNMKWMMADKAFTKKWTILMAECIKKGILISIIHNIDREIDEMSQAITSWIPLYMSGMIKSYYHTGKAGDRFSHTIFYCPGVGCINGCNTKKRSSDERYNYYTKPDDLKWCHDQFDTLMTDSKPLVWIEPYGKNAIPRRGISVIDSSGARSSHYSSPYEHMSVVIDTDSVRITRTTKPYITFIITHPLMRKAFQSYTERLKK